MKDLRSMNLEEMEEQAKNTGEKAFRGKQLFEWVHGKQATSWDEMKNLTSNIMQIKAENSSLKYTK